MTILRFFDTVSRLFHKFMSTAKRKDEHLEICLREPVDREGNFFDELHFEHNALPEINFAQIEKGTEFLGKKIAAPLIISSMTGGTPRGKELNERLARAAEKYQIALGIGSGRAMLENKAVAKTFQVRKAAPTIPLLANLGAVQLNYGMGISECQEIVKMLEADALCLHLNPLQEALQPEGDTNFKGLLKKIEAVVKALKIPVIVKEVGAGISKTVAKKLLEIGIQYIDVSGRGGTSWAYIEGQRKNKELGTIFADWGIPTPQAIQDCREIKAEGFPFGKNLKIIAGGGIRSGLDSAKALALGADYASMALPFLKAAAESEAALENLIEQLIHELKIAMFATGSKNLGELKRQKLTYRL